VVATCNRRAQRYDPWRIGGNAASCQPRSVRQCTCMGQATRRVAGLEQKSGNARRAATSSAKLELLGTRRCSARATERFKILAGPLPGAPAAVAGTAEEPDATAWPNRLVWQRRPLHSSVITRRRPLRALIGCVSALVAMPSGPIFGLDDRILVGLGLARSQWVQAIRPRRGAGA